MIKLNYPSIDQGYYVLLFGALYGPMSLKGETELLEFWKRSVHDTMIEDEGIWGENDVNHNKLIGEVTYVPSLNPQNSSHLPTPPYINSVSVTVLEKSKMVNLELSGGIAANGRSLIYYMSDTVISQCAFEQTSKNSWRYVDLQIRRNDPRTVRAYTLYEFTMQPHNGRVINVDTTTITFPGSPWSEDTSTDWSQTQSASRLFSYRPRNSVARETRSTWAMTAYRDKPSLLSPAYILEHLALYSNTDMLSHNSLIPVDYGELAMQASEKVIANNVNMLAFLNDLRNPASLIPKLKNLRKLKTYGDNYLTYKYGILPTISDLQSIYNAVTRLKPYLDKNGFKTYNARYNTSGSTAIYTVELEQRIKLAIDNEDDGLQRIVQSLENIGIFPTFENLWDLIPYSFVVDWFADIGDFLERVDTRLRLHRLNIRYVTMSQRRTAKIDAVKTGYPLVGWIGKVHYHRWVSDQCPVPSSFSQQKPGATSHWLEAGALLLQRTN